MSHRQLLLDADGTFLDFARTEKEALSVLFDRMGLDGDMSPLYHKSNAQCWKEFEQGVISMEELKSRRFALFFSEASIDADPAEASRLYIDLLAHKAYYLEGAEAMLSHLAEKHSLVCITNGISAVQRGRLERLDAMKWFTHVVISEEIGVQKPSVAFFDAVLSITGAQREDCLVIGDSLTSDIKGAMDSGIDAFHYHPGKAACETDSLIWGHSDSYEGLISAIDADQLDVEDQELIGRDVPAPVSPIGL